MTSMAAAPDPVNDPKAYQELLLSYLGDDDPAAAQAETPDRLRALVRDAGGDLRTKPAPGEWSVLELIGHATGAEIVTAARYRWIVAHDEPELIGYDQDLWVDRLKDNDADPDELLDLFAALRRASLALWTRTTSEEHDRVGMHAERGPESFDLLFRMLAGHDRLHYEQALRTLQSIRG
jgi:hypothetical protein